MSTIKISDLHSTESNLFSDVESYAYRISGGRTCYLEAATYGSFIGLMSPPVGVAAGIFIAGSCLLGGARPAY